MLAPNGNCNFRGVGRDGDFCRQPAVIVKIHEGGIARFELLCTEHMGSHRWIDEGRVMQWRADPPWTYREETKVPHRSRKKVTNA